MFCSVAGGGDGNGDGDHDDGEGGGDGDGDDDDYDDDHDDGDGDDDDDGDSGGGGVGDEYGDGVEEEETEEDEERRLEGDQVVANGLVLIFLFSVHKVNCLPIPIGSDTKGLQQVWIQLKFFSVPMGHAVSEPKEWSKESNEADDPGDGEQESPESENHLANY